VVQPTTPLLLTILPKEVARLSVPPNVNVKIGAQAELVVTLTRLHDFKDAVKVQLILPPNEKGINAAEVTVPAGQNQAKLIVSAPANAPPGNRANLVVRATAVINGNVTLTNEAKVNINVLK
jgi:hypothetical protein